jgi:hypothetical protein
MHKNSSERLPMKNFLFIALFFYALTLLPQDTGESDYFKELTSCVPVKEWNITQPKYPYKILIFDPWKEALYVETFRSDEGEHVFYLNDVPCIYGQDRSSSLWWKLNLSDYGLHVDTRIKEETELTRSPALFTYCHAGRAYAYTYRPILASIYISRFPECKYISGPTKQLITIHNQKTDPIIGLLFNQDASNLAIGYKDTHNGSETIDIYTIDWQKSTAKKLP